MIRGAGACATSDAARAAALELCAAGAGAVDAVIGGWLALALEEDALLAPLVLFVTGAGAPAEGRVFDGRAVVPGRGARKLRSYPSAEAAPPVTRAAVPRSFGAVSLALSYFGRSSLGALTTQAARALEKASLPERAALVRSLGALGAGALRSHADALLEAAGRGVGGPLTPGDLEAALPQDVAGKLRNGWLEVPFVVRPPREDVRLEVVLAADGRGLLAGAAVVLEPGRVLVPSLGASLPAGTPAPVRGKERPRPGTPLLVEARLASAHLDGADLLVGARGGPAHPPATPLTPDTFPAGFLGLLRTARETRAVL